MFGFGKKEATTDKGPAGSVTLGDGTELTVAQLVDCLGDSCPRPQLMTKKALNNAGSGDVIEVLVDNPSSMEAIPPMLPSLRATHLETIKADRQGQIILRKD